jgi:hypothetical protein
MACRKQRHTTSYLTIKPVFATQPQGASGHGKLSINDKASLPSHTLFATKPERIAVTNKIF